MIVGAIITLVLAAVSATVQTISNVMQARSGQKEADYNQKIANANARLADAKANNLAEQGEWERRKLAMEKLNQMGKARTGAAAGSVVIGSGTQASYEADIEDAYTLDLKQLDYDINESVNQARIEAHNYRQQAKLFGMQKKNMQRFEKFSLYSYFLGGTAPSYTGSAIGTLASSGGGASNGAASNTFSTGTAETSAGGGPA